MPEPEERFAMDEYSDMVAVAKPVVYITVEELVNTHRVRGCTLGGARKSVMQCWAGPQRSAQLGPCIPFLSPSCSYCWSTRTVLPLITTTLCVSSWRASGSCPPSLTSSVRATRGSWGQPGGLREGGTGR